MSNKGFTVSARDYRSMMRLKKLYLEHSGKCLSDSEITDRALTLFYYLIKEEMKER